MIRNFEDVIKLTGDDRKKEIIERLNDYLNEDLLSICQEANAYDGSFDFVNVFDPEDIGNYVDTSDAYRFMCSIVFGNIENVNDMLRFNAYGNLVSVSQWQLESEARESIDEIADWLMDNWNKSYSIYGDDEDLFNAWWDIDHGQYDWDEDEEDEQLM